MSIASPQLLLLGLIGYPLGHSLSPLLHQAALKASELAGDYRLFPIPPLPEGAPALQELLAQMREGQIHGLNVTIPHKQNILEYMDKLTPPASAIGAVNTIFSFGGQLVGDNTDAPGFKADLYSQLDIPRDARSAIVLGAGGSARAVVYALLREGWQVAVAARRILQARLLVESLEHRVHIGDMQIDEPSPPRNTLMAIDINPSGLMDYLSTYTSLKSRNLLIVNTTPIGMVPDEDACPWPVEVPFPQATFVYDLVYNPPETALVRMARAQGIPATTGLGMLVEQAALAYERWTGCPASREAMHASVSEQNETLM